MPVDSTKIELSRKQFISLVNSRMYNKFHVLANFTARYLERGSSETSKLLGSWLTALEDYFIIKALPIPADNLAYNSNSMHENPSLSCCCQTHLKKHGNSPEYFLRDKRKTFVNTFHHPSHLRLLLGLLVRKRRTIILSKDKEVAHQHGCLVSNSLLETLT